MAKHYQSVSEMVGAVIDDKAFKQEFEREVADRSLAGTLFAMRCRNGITQADMARRLGCTQSRLSKLEHSGMDGIRMSDLVAYAKALDLNLSISFHKSMTAVECVKFHALQIKKHLDHLARLAHRDDEIFAGVKTFYAEYILNVLRLFKDSVQRLPKVVEAKPPRVEICAPTEDEETETEALMARQANGAENLTDDCL